MQTLLQLSRLRQRSPHSLSSLDLYCRYLDNVFPDMMVPTREKLFASGEVTNPDTNQCLDTLSAKEAQMKPGA